MQRLKAEFGRCVVDHINKTGDYEDLEMERGKCFLLYGPPGCGKTLIAKAVANEAGVNFIHIKGRELPGEIELNARALQSVFNRAKTYPPCIIFFDLVTALTTEPGRDGEELLNQFKQELDDAKDQKGVYVIGTTDRPDLMDKDVLQRFGKLVHVPLPSAEERVRILQTLARKKPIDGRVDLVAIGKEHCKKFSGADLSEVLNDAAIAAVADLVSSSPSTPRTIKQEHFERALEKVRASVSDEQIQYCHLSL